MIDCSDLARNYCTSAPTSRIFSAHSLDGGQAGDSLLQSKGSVGVISASDGVQTVLQSFESVRNRSARVTL
jgi:hypothetical protein